jgi:hypothetical protein
MRIGMTPPQKLAEKAPQVEDATGRQRTEPDTAKKHYHFQWQYNIFDEAG